MKILITGMSGTIGTRLYEYLRVQHDVMGVDIHPNEWLPAANIATKLVDLRDEVAVASLPGEADIIVHLAANARVYELVKEPRLALDNMIINFNVFDFARQKRIPRLLFASSRETYGNIRYDEAISEDLVRLENCESPYAASKSSGESMLHAYGNVYGLGFVNLRFSNVYGMYDDSDRVIPLWMRSMLKNEDIVVFGRDKLLDFTYIDDTINGIIRTIERFDQIKGQAINLAYGRGTKLLDVCEKLLELTGSSSKVLIEDSRSGEVWRFTADITRARELLGYNPVFDIDAGLEKTSVWYRQYLT